VFCIFAEEWMLVMGGWFVDFGIVTPLTEEDDIRKTKIDGRV